MSQRADIDMQARWDWWCRVDGVEHGAPTVTWRPEGWPAVVLVADHILGA